MYSVSWSRTSDSVPLALASQMITKQGRQLTVVVLQIQVGLIAQFVVVFFSLCFQQLFQLLSPWNSV